MLPHFGPMELVIILVIALMIFGAGKLPEVGNALGRGIKEFKKATTDDLSREIGAGTSAPVPAASAQPAPVATASTAATAAGPYCPKCGAQGSADGRFCPHCGAAMPTAAA